MKTIKEYIDNQANENLAVFAVTIGLYVIKSVAATTLYICGMDMINSIQYIIKNSRVARIRKKLDSVLEPYVEKLNNENSCPTWYRWLTLKDDSFDASRPYYYERLLNEAKPIMDPKDFKEFENLVKDLISALLKL